MIGYNQQRLHIINNNNYDIVLNMKDIAEIYLKMLVFMINYSNLGRYSNANLSK